MAKVTKQYLKDHDISHIVNDVYLGAGISKVALYDPEALNPDSFCLIAIVQTDNNLSDNLKSKIEKVLLKDNPYKFEEKEYPVYVNYRKIAKAR